MFQQHLLHEIITNGMYHSIVNILSLVSILCGISVIVSKNPIVSVLFLIGLFLAVAGYLMALGINFIGLSYLLVYVGAVSILFLFILMLINVRISELVTENNNSVPLAIIIIILASASVSPLRAINESNMFALTLTGQQDKYPLSSYNEVSIAISSLWDGKLSETSHITSIGNIIYTNYPMWLILTSIILLLAMIGSILITIKS